MCFVNHDSDFVPWGLYVLYVFFVIKYLCVNEITISKKNVSRSLYLR
jgi:hypothetical protein